jgi:transposase
MHPTRERLMAQVTDGMSCREAAELNNVVPSTVVKDAVAARRDTQVARPMGASSPICSRSGATGRFQASAKKPDLMLHALSAELAEERAVVISCDTLRTFLKREDLPRPALAPTCWR